jgi:hypothetical protein
MIEAALVMPLLSLLFLAILFTGLHFRMELALTNAAIQGTIASVQAPFDLSAACSKADNAVRKVYIGTVDTISCEIVGKTLTLTVRDTLHFLTPLPCGTVICEYWPISITEKAQLP